MNAYTKSPAPHIQSQDSVPRMMWRGVALLLLPAAGAFFIFGWPAAMNAGISVICACAAEVLILKKLDKKIRLYDGSAVFTSLLFFLLLPAGLPAWMTGLGSFAAIALGKEVFGGLGANSLNPALVGRAFLHISFPNAMGWPAIVEEPASTAVFALLFLGSGLFLLHFKLVDWDLPLLFLGAAAGVSGLSGLNRWSWEMFGSGAMLVTAFFILTDPVTIPLGRSARRTFAVLCAVSYVILREIWRSDLHAATYSVLTCNAAVPWIEHLAKKFSLLKKKII